MIPTYIQFLTGGAILASGGILSLPILQVSGAILIALTGVLDFLRGRKESKELQARVDRLDREVSQLKSSNQITSLGGL